MNKKIFITIGVIAVIAIGVFVYLNKSNKQVTKVGVIAPLTGQVATYGQDLKKGIDVAFDEEPDFKVFYQDSKAQANTGLNAMHQLRNVEGINYFVGDATTTVSLLIAEEAQKNKTPLLVPIASGNDIKTKGDYIFQDCPRNEKQSIAAAKFIAENLKLKKVGIIYQQISYGVELSDKLVSELKKYGIEPLFNESFQDAKTGLKNIIVKAKEAQPEIIFIPMEYESAALVLKQCREQGVTCYFIGTDGAYSEKLVELAGKAAEGFYFTMFPLNTNSEYYKEFETKFKAKYNALPNVFSCYGYESARNMITAIKNTDGSPETVKDYFYNNEFDSFTGKLKFDEMGEVIRDFGIIKVINGNFIFEK
ncbi:amino acid-binding protein [Bacteroidia bacterium]|nr:amino acid-binding protein [Bacteroidia bacterium]